MSADPIIDPHPFADLSPYALAFPTYWAGGWRGILPLPYGAKKHPPSGFTGYNGVDPSYPDCTAWSEEGKRNICLRMPDGVIGIDVDHYDGKSGGDTLTGLVARNGGLPPTWLSTSRDDGISGIRLYRVPSGISLVTKLPGIEFIQPHHRYAVVFPSMHPEGRMYQWVNEITGEAAAQPPSLGDLPMLPAVWVEALRTDRQQHRKADVTDWRAVLDAMPQGDPCAHITKGEQKAEASGESRHDTYNEAVLAVLGAGRRGCPGAAAVVEGLHDRFLAEVLGDKSRRPGEAESEWERNISGAVAIVVAADPQGKVCSESVDWGSFGGDSGAGQAERAEDEQGEQAEQGQPAASGQPFAEAINRAKPGKYVSRDKGLLAANLTADVMQCFDNVARGPGGMWAYTGGVWLSVRHRGDAVDSIAARMLGNQYRPAHVKVVHAYAEARAEVQWLHGHPELDGFSDTLNFSNTLLDWATGALRPHTSDCLSSWQLPYDYDPTADCPKWMRFLSEALPADMLEPDGNGVAPWQEDVGYILLAGNPLHIAFLLRGGGRNGKGVYMTVLQALVGHGHCSSLSLEDMVESDRKFRLSGLVGSALNLCGEIDPKYLKSTATFKELTGGDQIMIEDKYQKPYPYRPWSTMVFSANNDFAAVDRSAAYFERWQVRSFPNFIPAEQRDPHLARDIIATELPGIARLAVDGLRNLMARGSFHGTESATEQKATFRKHSDHLIRWAEECLDFDENHTASRAALTDSYVDWCKEEQVRELAAATRYAALKAFGLERGVEVEESKYAGQRGFSGVRVIR